MELWFDGDFIYSDKAIENTQFHVIFMSSLCRRISIFFHQINKLNVELKAKLNVISLNKFSFGRVHANSNNSQYILTFFLFCTFLFWSLFELYYFIKYIFVIVVVVYLESVWFFFYFQGHIRYYQCCLSFWTFVYQFVSCVFIDFHCLSTGVCVCEFTYAHFSPAV